MNRRLGSAVIAAVLLGGSPFAPAVHAQQGTVPMHRGRPGGSPIPATGLSPIPRLAPAPARISGAAQDKKTAAGESFFIVASVDQSKAQFLLKRPTEVTLLVKVDANTKYLDDSGQPLKSTDFRAGDTVWLTSSGGGDEPTAVRIRKGEMTVADLHRYYLDYPEIK
ncbi:MAG TPA: hypothetical protein VNV41_04165 [Candidatus Acidoferrales bacterium]|jgi:hypothetical protein|nr:hypothetical protein [Candidatus Acidoferrales bacterium]